MTKLTWSSPKLTVRMLTITAILVAIQVVLSKISIGSDSLVKISLGFIATALVGYFLGPWLGGIALVLNDLIANTLLSTGSSFFYWFYFFCFHIRNNRRRFFTEPTFKLAAIGYL